MNARRSVGAAVLLVVAAAACTGDQRPADGATAVRAGASTPSIVTS
jgi:hypothetical protein